VPLEACPQEKCCRSSGAIGTKVEQPTGRWIAPAWRVMRLLLCDP
jgi:hypothetical protein